MSKLKQRYKNLIEIFNEKLGDGWTYEIKTKLPPISGVFIRNMFDFQIDTASIQYDDVLIFKNSTKGIIMGFGKDSANGRSMLFEIADMLDHEGNPRSRAFSCGVTRIEGKNFDSLEWIKSWRIVEMIDANIKRN